MDGGGAFRIPHAAECVYPRAERLTGLSPCDVEHSQTTAHPRM